MNRLWEALSGIGGDLRGLKLPVRIAVPTHEEIAAAALSTLADGLADGLAVGAGLNSGSFLPAIAAPLAGVGAAGTETEAAIPELGAPAGGSGGGAVTASTATGGGSVTQVAAAPTTAPAPTPVPLETTPSEPSPSGSGAGGGDSSGDQDSLPLTATVVSVSVTGKSYAVSDEYGNLFSVFAKNAPKTGDQVKTRITPLLNGTFLEASTRQVTGRKGEAEIRGVVSYLDAQTGIVVVSSRGVSLALDGREVIANAGPNLRVAATAEAKISLAPVESAPAAPPAGESDPTGPIPPSPEARILELEVNFYEGTAVELTGKLEVLDPVTRKARFAADSSGVLTGTVEATLPPEVPFGKLKVGKPYCVTLREGADGLLTLTGFSPAWSEKGANDPAESYG
ncbi:MAG: hypothetical protein ACKORM_00860 [Solirubrobacterales bacterium]